ncbi:16S rRNA (uracil(1498)-N(3))-methyltransferase [Humitalea sp. 24SJ18S-53]|uniref:16S rRNA (uracil(1498)-N(3))-methyltransferase n=1 Tax=Humitalea sp. 24SJ18S-53 TaxID=3422307 RepID=UPI003D67A6B1
MTTIPRLHCDQPLATGAEVPGDEAAARYFGSVLRRGPGDPLLLFNARDGEFAATIAAVRKDRIAFTLGARLRAPAAAVDIRLVVAVLKRDAMEWAVQKATELGVASIAPVFCLRSVPDRLNTDRLRAIAREAAEQSERLDVPAIAEPMPLHRLLDGWDATPLLVGAERAGAAPLPTALAGRRPPLALLVGPEGGFAGAELDDMTRRAFVVPTSLGPRILRADTAVVAALAVMQALAGDASGP